LAQFVAFLDLRLRRRLANVAWMRTILAIDIILIDATSVNAMVHAPFAAAVPAFAVVVVMVVIIGVTHRSFPSQKLAAYFAFDCISNVAHDKNWNEDPKDWEQDAKEIYLLFF
jgi:Na+/glutamate symporter